MPLPPPALSVRTATLAFGACLLAVTVCTFLSVGGIGANQALCHDNQMLAYWTPGYTAFVMQMNMVKPWTCKWFQVTQWWTIGLQITFWLSVCLAWAWGTLERSQAALYAHGAVASALSVASALHMMSEGDYYTGDVYTNGLIAFYGFFLGSIFNGLLGVAGCELIHARRAARARASGQHTGATCAYRASDSGSELAAKDARV